MKKLKGWQIALIVVGAIVLIVGIWMIASYNGLVNEEETINEKQGLIETQIQARADKIPNLVATVKNYAAHEQSIYDAITSARQKVKNATTTEEMLEANSELHSALQGLDFDVIVESNPEFKANENYTSLQDSIEGAENRIQIARGEYVTAVKEYNASVRKFPSSIIASMFGFETVEYFKSTPGADEGVSVDDIFNN